MLIALLAEASTKSDAQIWSNTVINVASLATLAFFMWLILR